jgi:hypothetical protein
MIKEQSTEEKKYTTEEFRKILYDSTKHAVSIPVGKEKKYYSFKKLEDGKNESQKEALYQAWGKLFFSSIEKLPDYPKMSGIKDIYKIAKGSVKNDEMRNMSEQDFFLTYACDLPFVKNTSYCVQPQRDIEEYYGDYENDQIGMVSILEKSISLEDPTDVVKLEIEKDKDTILVLELTKRTDVLNVFTYLQGVKVPTSIGTVKFKCPEPDENGTVYCDFTLKITHPKYTGTYEFKSLIPDGEYDDESDSEEDQVIQVDNKPNPKPTEVPKPKEEPTPPKPQKTQNYCSLASLEKSKWKIGCENDIIGLLNKKFLSGRHGNSLTQELIDELKNLDWISSGDGITKDEYNVIRSKVPDLKKLEENKKIKKIIKESVRRNLKDIYYRS